MEEDPLRWLGYSLQGYYQADRIWGRVDVGTSLGIVPTSLYAYRRPRTITARVLDRRGQEMITTYGRDQRALGVQFRLPLYLESNVRTTTAVSG